MMRLCQKCYDDATDNFFISSTYDSGIVPESDCEFWAHKELNVIKRIQSIEDRLSKRGSFTI